MKNVNIFLFPLHPECFIKKIWNYVIIIMLVLTAILTPFRVCIVDDGDTYIWPYIDNIFDAIFSIDIIVNFLSAYIDK